MYVAWAALAIYVGLYFPVFVATSRVAVHRFSVPLTIAVPVVWVGLEYLRATLMTGFAWYFVAHSQYEFTELIQISDLFGAYGVSFVVVLTSACLAGLIPLKPLERLKLFPPVQVPKDFDHLPEEGIVPQNSSKAEFRRPWLHVAASMTVLVATLTYGVVRRGQAEFVDGPRVALIQGNFPTSLKHDPSEFTTIFRYHDALTGMTVPHQPDLIVWPETMFRWPLRVVEPGVEEAQLLAMAPPGVDLDQFRWIDSWSDPTVRDTLQQLSQRAGAAMAIGIDCWVAGKDGMRVYNSSAFVTPQQGIVDRYDKMHRVVFGEYVPLKDELPMLHTFAPFPTEFGLTKGDSAHIFKHGGWSFSPVICFEDTVPHLVRSIANGADQKIDVFINHTNDGWFKGSSELDQHLITASFRAVETRTPMVRAVNTGVSAVIDGDGVIREPDVFIDGDAQTPETARRSLRDPVTGRWNKSLNAALVMDVPLDNRQSAYVRHGDWFAQSCCFAALLCITAGPFRRRQAVTA
jgi:apolipoprotein N-acyltransferase